MQGKNYEDMILFTVDYGNCERRESTKGSERRLVYTTPVGKLELGYRYVRESDSWFLVEHPLREETDYRTLIYLMEQITLQPNYRRFDETAEEVGGGALLVPLLCPGGKTAFQALVEHWAGTEQLVYSIMDYPELVQGAVVAMRRVNRDAARIAAQSSAEVFISWEDSSTTNISPDYYKNYILPEIDEWCEILHGEGKLYMQHACGHLHDLMPLIASSKIDCLESLSPPPTGNIEVAAARKILPAHIALVGGIEPTVLLNSSPAELAAYTSRLLAQTAGTRYVLANSDSCPPGVAVEKFKQLSTLVSR